MRTPRLESEHWDGVLRQYKVHSTGNKSYKNFVLPQDSISVLRLQTRYSRLQCPMGSSAAGVAELVAVLSLRGKTMKKNRTLFAPQKPLPVEIQGIHFTSSSHASSHPLQSQSSFSSYRLSSPCWTHFALTLITPVCHKFA